MFSKTPPTVDFADSQKPFQTEVADIEKIKIMSLSFFESKKERYSNRNAQRLYQLNSLVPFSLIVCPAAVALVTT